jgi:tetratricopeptide (TPR) repeat protein
MCGMENSGIEETLPTLASASAAEAGALDQSQPETPQEAVQETVGQAAASGEASRRGARGSCVIVTGLGLLFLLVVALISGLSGYWSGISLRQDAANTQIANSVAEQFRLGVQELEQGNYYRARQRFEYVIRLDPGYPGATDKLTEALLRLSTTATPTLVPTPTLSPTPDLRGVEQLFAQAQAYQLNSDWTNAIETLLVLRKTDPAYRAIEVDDMLFLALRNRGRDKIVNEADLEGGIYDLTLASRFGPLDAEAQSFLNWTGLYITGASFWGIDWEQAVYYFSQVAPQLPNLRDKSGYTATQRLAMALVEFGNQLAQNDQWCSAAKQYETALSIGPDPQVEQALGVAANNCAKGEAQKPDKKRTPTPEGP